MAKGEITHVEFPADDPERAKRFYAAVAGWEFGEQPGMEGYFLFRTEERHGGAIGKRGETIARQLRIYITVDSLEEGCAAAEANGGTIIEQPTDIGGGFGRFAVVRDSEGTEVGLWQTAEDATAG
ncbi:MAG: VOC family protein [Chloroflexota bacterium]|nr:VOC family protein [Chloroflexota bacterium]